MKVDLNSDLGEGAGHDDEILSLVSSANIACGFHAGNPAGIFNSIRVAKEKGVAVGAHPSLDDRKNFGRIEMQISGAEVYALVADKGAILFAPAGTELFKAAHELELQTASEVFADRNYNSDGTLVSRTRPDALLRDPGEAAERVVRMLKEGKIRAIDGSDVVVRPETICLHGDTPGAVEFARILRARLESEGVEIRAPRRMATLK